jgi:tryptophan halogenase
VAERRIRQIVIVGGGTAGWMAAAILAPIARDGLSITLIESSEIGTVGVGEATIPQINLFNQAVGIDDEALLAATRGTYKLGIEFVDWLQPGHRYMHAFGDVGRNVGIVPFQHYWQRGRALGIAKELASYSLNETAARAGKMQRGKLRTTDLLPPMPYAFHFDASLYARMLRSLAESRGAVRIEGKIVDVARDGDSGDVTSVKLESDRRIEGDLFLDCSGFRGLLVEQTLATGFEDWSHWLPCDRAVAVPCAHASDTITPYTRSTARSGGWQWRIPLQHRIGNGLVYSSAHLGDDEAAATLLANLDGPAEAEPRLLRFTAGRRKKTWSHNVIALGLAGGFLEPLESTSIHLVQSGLQRLLRMLPHDRGGDATADEFNRQSALEYERIRDFIILHYKATNRSDTPFWRECAAMSVPDTLMAKMALFEEAGHIFRTDEDLFTEVAWMQILIGQGIAPARHHPMADSVSEADLKSFLDSWEEVIDREVAQMPPHEQFLGASAEAA